MALRINNNISSINGQRNLTKNDQMLARSLEKLSSGLKINRAADNAAGLVISEQMRAQIKGLAQATSNSETAVTMVQTAEGALDEVSSLLTKARELTLHASNEGANDTNQLAADQAELDNVIKAVSRIGEQTQFGTKKLLNGSLNGATTISDSSKLSRVRVGNLANNSAITAGTVTVAVTAGNKESIALKNASTAITGYVFNGNTSGLKIGSRKLVSGATATLVVNGTSLSFTAGAGGATAAQIASGLNTHVSKPAGFTVGLDADNAVKVQRAGMGVASFTSSVSYARASGANVAATVGTKEAVIATVKATGPNTSATAAAVIFNAVSNFSGVATTSTLARTGVRFTATIGTATGGGYSVTVTGATNEALSGVMTRLQTAIRGNGGAVARNLSGATLSMTSGSNAGGLKFQLERSSNALAANLVDFNFTLEIDHENAAITRSEVQAINMTAMTFATGTAANGGTFGTAGNTGVATASLSGATLLRTGRAISMTINGVTKTLTGNRSLTALATAFTAAFSGSAAGVGIRVAFRTGGAQMSGLNGAGMTNVTGEAMTGRGFVIYNSNGAEMTISLSVDQSGGNDAGANAVEQTDGTAAAATLNLDTTAQVRTTGTLFVAGSNGHAASTLSSTTGASTYVNGSAVTAALTTADGSVINLKSTLAVSGSSITLDLTSGSVTAGYQAVKLEISSAYGTAGGSTSFKLTNGAEFQIGANAGQKAGVTFDSVVSSELGRNVTGAGTITSLDDMLSTKKSALTAGLTTEALKVIDAAIDEVTNQRGKMGAFQANTLETNLNSLRVSSENLTAAESVIRDTDFAQESARFTRNQILVQASQSMLAQANQLPQSVLQLLQ